MNMIHLEEQQQINFHDDHLFTLYHWMMEQKDVNNAKKILDLYEKRVNKEFIIGFTGHFSAGKSSMINNLLGKEILPKSPIPTSANIVKIKSGQGLLRVFLEQGDIVEIHEPYDLEMIKQYSTDKGRIKSLEIQRSDSLLPPGAVIMDTPGIDAADDADGMLTESSLHLVDFLFYMMDYNHVQSEVNLYFLKNIQQMGIPYYIVVNQIDKHNEKELAFTEFTESIKETFWNWDLHPERIFFSSLLDETVPYNELSKIKETLFSVFQKKEEKMQDAFLRSVQQLVVSHKKYIDSLFEGSKAPSTNVRNVMDEEIGTLKRKLKEIEDMPAQLEMDFRHGVDYTLANAYLMPASLRDMIHSYLESMDSSFKVGIFSSKKKTALERERRLDRFYHALRKNIESLIQWKLRDKVLLVLKNYDIHDDNLRQQVQSLSIDYTKENLINHVKPGAKLNGDYVLHYADDVANDIKRLYKQKILEILPGLKQFIVNKNEEKKQKYQKKLTELEEQLLVEEKRKELEIKKNQCILRLDSYLMSPNPTDLIKQQLKDAFKNKYTSVQTLDDLAWEEEEESNESQTENEETSELNIDGSLSANRVIESINIIHGALKDLKVFKSFLQELIDKKISLANRSYTIALFGAFSAGKSSFINALIGNHLLPASPNPTTAVVNRIRPITEQYGHKTVVITFKREETVIKEILQITKKFSPSSNGLEQLLDWIEKENIYSHPQLNEMYQSYLQALLRGWSKYEQEQGKEKIISIDELKLYATDESIACYIESADVYFDCSLTRQGITLVDTPGADSMNIRHTNVAFNYIKHADAIIYVTYFNHAFSRADRDFLMQLGRVKDAFQLDKMFFMINASDLANNRDELQLVVQYVKDQLHQYGVRLPRLYPISSKSSLQQKIDKVPLNGEMIKFETDFYRFIHHDLTAITVQSAVREMERISHALEQYIASIQLDESAKQERITVLTEKKTNLIQTISDYETSSYENNIRDKVEKQLYYVVERLAIRFHDMFKDCFNPTTVTESGRRGEEELKVNTEQLIDIVSFELFQEIQAVSLRVEAYMTEQMLDLFQRLREISENTDGLFVLTDWNQLNWDTPPFKQGMEKIDLSIFHRVFATYKGTKSFFVENEKEKMKEKMYDILYPYAKQYVDDNQSQMLRTYLNQWNTITEKLKTEMIDSLNVLLQNYVEMIDSKLDISMLQEKLAVIHNQIEKWN